MPVWLGGAPRNRTEMTASGEGGGVLRRSSAVGEAETARSGRRRLRNGMQPVHSTMLAARSGQLAGAGTAAEGPGDMG